MKADAKFLLSKNKLRLAMKSTARVITIGGQLVHVCRVQLNIFNASSFACDDLLTGLSLSKRKQLQLFPRLKACYRRGKWADWSEYFSLSPNCYVYDKENNKLLTFKRVVLKYYYIAVSELGRDKKPQIKATTKLRRVSKLLSLYNAWLTEDFKGYLSVRLKIMAKLGSILFSLLKINSGFSKAPMNVGNPSQILWLLYIILYSIKYILTKLRVSLLQLLRYLQAITSSPRF